VINELLEITNELDMDELLIDEFMKDELLELDNRLDLDDRITIEELELTTTELDETLDETLEEKTELLIADDFTLTSVLTLVSPPPLPPHPVNSDRKAVSIGTPIQ
jgi:hypothetical protein